MAKTLVFGDIIVDKYTYCKTKRTSREAPISIFEKEKQELKLGGAVNVAANIKSLGGNPVLFGIIVDDEYGKFVIDTLNKLEIPFIGIILNKNENIQTIVKERFCNENKHLFRVDSGIPFDPSFFSLEDITKCLTKFETALQNVSSLVVSDYGYKTIELVSIPIINKLYAKYNIPVFVDSRYQINKFNSVHTLLPSVEDLSLDSGDNVVNFCKKLILESNSNYLLLKAGKNGLLLFTKEKEIYKSTSKSNVVVDSCGAGDSVLAAWVVATLENKSNEEKLTFAQEAGDEKVKFWGTHAVKLGE